MLDHGKTYSIHQKLKDSALFRVCSPSFLEKLSEQARVLNVPKNQVLFLHEEKGERFFLILEGCVKLFRETPNGAQAVLDILSPGSIFGETALFHQDVYPFSAEAVSEGVFVSFPLETLRSEIKQNSKFSYALLSFMAQHRKRLDAELEHRVLQNAPQRIGCFLLRLVAPEDLQQKQIKLRLPYDKTLVAAYLGMQPETFSRALAKLKSETGVRVKGAIIEVEDLHQLSQYSCTACSSDFPCRDLKSAEKISPMVSRSN